MKNFVSTDAEADKKSTLYKTANNILKLFPDKFCLFKISYCIEININHEFDPTKKFREFHVIENLFKISNKLITPNYRQKSTYVTIRIFRTAIADEYEFCFPVTL